MSPVKLVGVGPGHPGLATLQAVEAIKDADVIRHSDGCGAGLLHLASAGTDIAALQSTEEIVRMARAGKRVTVLFPGNPYAFSNGSEVAEKLERAGVDFEAVPGLIVELAAPVMSGIPLTIEGQSASIGFGLVKGSETVVLRLASGWWESGISKLLADGRKADTPAALILNPGQSGQHRVSAPLGELARKAATYGLRGDALLVLGPGVSLAERLDTMSKRPLHGRRILITRARHQVDPFRRELVELGASVVEIPTLQIESMPMDDQVTRAISHLERTALVIFASANAVDIFFQMLLASGSDARAFHGSKLCAIGQETAESLEAHGLRPELITSEYTAEGLAKALEGWEMDGMRVLVPRAEVARDALPSLLANRGAEVEILPVYRAKCPPEAGDALLRLFNNEGVDVITFTSSSTVYNFVRAFPEDRLPAVLGDAEIACMGPVTADTARKLGLSVAIVAREYTTHGLVQAIAESAARK
ncbi:MAG TPA: uroporphyrinogen-III synthase [Candidatus Dormibacteraeota bacterium]|jgi:uroporphyrinogen III methyltransferase / synthase|nr:uroporphyrinogen-III synthase [Candidatus Dormibacteraeota bacterium]